MLVRDEAVTTLTVAGCNFPNCPRTTVYEASERDFRLVLAEDAISGVYDRGLDEMRAIGVNVMSTDEIGARLTAAAAPARRAREPRIPDPT
jgi:nicotinamidase-related amidase